MRHMRVAHITGGVACTLDEGFLPVDTFCRVLLTFHPLAVASICYCTAVIAVAVGAFTLRCNP